jgi:hypothetical protein
MLTADHHSAPFALAHVETMATALSEYPVAIADREEDIFGDSFGEISIFPGDPDVEIV